MALSGRAEGNCPINSQYFSFYVDWTAVQSVSENYSDITTYVRIETKSLDYRFNTVGQRNAWIEINGDRYSWTQIYNCNPWPSNPFTINVRTVRVYHNEDGTKRFHISAYANLSAKQWGMGECTAGQDFDLDPIPRTPSAPPYLTVDMRRDGSIPLSWGASSGYVTGYDLEYLYSDPNTNAYSGWIPLASTAATSYLDGSEKWAAGTGFTYRVRARNGNLASGWTDTGWVFRKGGLYVSNSGERRFGTVYAPGTPPVKAKGVFIGNANGVPVESIRIIDEKNRPVL